MGACLKKSLLFFAPSAYPLGGVATWLDYLLPGLARKGWNVTLGLVSGKHHDVETYLKLHPSKSGVSTVAIENPTGTREGRTRSICRIIDRLKPDAIIGVNIPDAYVAVERLRARGAKSPHCVMTIHGIQPDLYDDAEEFKNVLDAVICTNMLACRLAVNGAGVEDKRVFYAPYGVVPSSGGTNEGGDNGVLRICYVGRLDCFQKRVQDIPAIITALESAGIPYILKIAGGGPAENALKEQLSGQIRRGGAKFQGVLSQADVEKRIYASSDVLLVTSFWETGPIVIWEAMARGVSVVTSRYFGSGLEGALKHGKNCMMFPIGDVAAAAKCLGTVYNAEERSNLAAYGRELVQRRYTQEKSIESWDKALNTALGLPMPDGPDKSRAFKSAGRLDRLLGCTLAEHARSLLKMKFVHSDPGGEWPHSYGVRSECDKKFWIKAENLDAIKD